MVGMIIHWNQRSSLPCWTYSLSGSMNVDPLLLGLGAMNLSPLSPYAPIALTNHSCTRPANETKIAIVANESDKDY